jgi:hypothetical protein
MFSIAFDLAVAETTQTKRKALAAWLFGPRRMVARQTESNQSDAELRRVCRRYAELLGPGQQRSAPQGHGFDEIDELSEFHASAKLRATSAQLRVRLIETFRLFRRDVGALRMYRIPPNGDRPNWQRYESEAKSSPATLSL